MQNEYQIIFQGKKTRFPRCKAKLKCTLEKHILRPKQTCLQSQTYWQLFFSLNFRLYFEAAGPDCFNVFCKILVKSKFQLELFLDHQNGENIGPGHHDITIRWRHCDYPPSTVNFQKYYKPPPIYRPIYL